MVSEKTAFISYAETPGRFVTGVGGIKVPILGKGSVATVMCSGSSSQNIILYNCVHIPSDQPNLLSLSRLDRAGGSIRIKSGSIQLFDSTGISICDGKADGRLYTLNMHSTSNLTPSTFSSNNPRGRTWEEWHKAMGHINVQSLKLMKEKNLVEGMEVIQSPLEFICEACIQGKQVTKPLPKKSQTLYSEIGELILTDLWGPAQVKGKGGFEYFISFTDAATRFSVVGFLKRKSDAFSQYRRFATHIQTQFNKKIKSIRFDSGMEFLNASMLEFLADQGTTYTTTSPHTSSQNGIAERLNRTILDHSRAMLFDSELPKSLWPYAVSYSIFLKNRSPTRALVNRTPYEAFFNKKPDVATIHPFGCDVWVLDQSGTKGKLDPKSNKYKFIGITEETRAFWYYKSNGEIAKSRNTIFPSYHPTPFTI